ncbi:MAG: guanine deaminase [Methylococcaceae bacterium]|nr:guanine deaminase [Methylococcaceae bacterium]
MSVIYLGVLAHLRADPFESSDALEIIPSGALRVDEEGRIVQIGEKWQILAQTPEARCVDYGDGWLIPGLIDGHIHFPQYYATAAEGGQLLDWLAKSIFPQEAAYADVELAEDTARRFVHHLLACGTTTAMVFGSQFFHANLALFDAAARHGLRLIAGTTLMDRASPLIPESLLQPSVAQARADAETLIARCRADSLLHYALTPRWALSCTAEMMEMCADLLRAHPETYLQTHINENRSEIEAVMRHFSQCRDYLEVYQRFGLIGERTMLAHNIHASDGELVRLAQAQCAVCHCPSSNLFLGSGLFPLARHVQHGIDVAVGTDIGAGTRFSLWENLSDAYKIQQLQGMSLDAAQLLYLGTLGGAKALQLEHETGNFAPGKSADFFVLDGAADGYLNERLRRCESLGESLFCLLHLATARQVSATYVRGRRVFSQNTV